MFSKSFRGRPENVLGTYRSNVLGTSRIKFPGTSFGCHFETSPGRQIGTSPDVSSGLPQGHPGDVGGGRPRDALGTNICRLGLSVFLAQTLHTFDRNIPSKSVFSDFPQLELKFSKLFMSIFKQNMGFSSKFESLFSVMRDNPSALF